MGSFGVSMLQRVLDPQSQDTVVYCIPVQAKNILIAVGGKPYVLPIPGSELTITSDEALELEERPQKITGTLRCLEHLSSSES